jgi:cobalt-precorrin-7 (C5)-methyltransferase
LAKKIYLVGAGPGSPEYVTPAAKKAVRQATLVVGAQRALELFQEDIKGETRVLTAENLDELLHQSLTTAGDGKPVALISTGDPTFFGLLRPLLKKSWKDIDIDIVPGISSIQVCASRLKICLDDVELFSFHGRNPANEKERLIEALRKKKLVLILPDPRSFQPDQIAKYLIESGLDHRMPAAVCENLTFSNEKVIEGDLMSISNEEFGSMSIMVIGAVAPQKIPSGLPQ